MDFIKEVYDLLTLHIGVEHRGNKVLGPEHNDLKKDVQALLTHAFKIGKILGAEEMKLVVDKNYTEVKEVMDAKHEELRKDMLAGKYKSNVESG